MNKLIQDLVKATQLSPQQIWWILEYITKKSRAQLQYANHILSPEQQAQLDKIVDQIVIHHKPLAYVLGWVPFLDLTLKIQPPTLIPRPETEAWVYDLICMLKNTSSPNLHILDIGTGSGCIGLSLAHAFPDAVVYCVDITPSALNLAQENARHHNLENVYFVQSDLFENLSLDIQFDLIVSNPPYIDPQVILEPSVSAWEDHGALFADNNGLFIIEKMIQQAPKFLKKNKPLPYQVVLEMDALQGSTVKKILYQAGFKNIDIKKDQFNRDRTAWAAL